MPTPSSSDAQLPGMTSARSAAVKRRYPIGAEPTRSGVSFRVWAPSRSDVAVVIDGRDHPLESESNGYFSGVVSDAGPGTRYHFRLDGGESLFPDPASRFQPEGPHGPSQVIDPAFDWTDADWRGPSLKGAVIYELHVGTFTLEGTYEAAMTHLPELAGLGVNVIELMPLNEFAGEFGWGYDGVDLWAPTRLYGTPDHLRRFVDAAHRAGIAVILDVVYNHFGPDGAYVREFTPHYFTTRYEIEWGEAINFDGEQSPGVREFFIENAACWIDEYHLDGLRIDATQSMHDSSPTHVLSEICAAARRAAGKRQIVLIAENEPQDTALVREYGIDAMWNDDWHHSARVALTGRAEAYYSDYRGTAQELASMARLGFLYQGQRYRWQQKRRGSASRDLSPEHLVCFLQNHDQVANTGRGGRLRDLTSPARLRAMTALLLLQPQTPMLFQGQEFGASTPFTYFADHKPELAALVAKGRAEFIRQFPSLREMEIEPPHARATFEQCRLDHSERETNAHIVRLHRDLLRLRRDEPFGSQQTRDLEGSALSADCLALRWFGNDRLLIVNLGRTLELDPANDPLLAPPAGANGWQTLWSSEAMDYGGSGMPEPEQDGLWKITGESAVVLRPLSTAAPRA